VAKLTTRAVPDRLAMRLFAPGMTVLHRAGLGGLAATLRHIEAAYRSGALTVDEVPGGPWPPAGPPWAVEEDAITLHFGTPEAAPAYFDRLYRLAFRIQDGLISLPGQYGELPPPVGVRVALQEGLCLSFYDHGPQSRGLGEITTVTVEVDDRPVPLTYRRVLWYKHQRDGAALALEALAGSAPVSRMLFPGVIVRHDRWKEASALALPASLAVPLLFAPVGCLALRAGGRRVNVNGRRVFRPGAAVVMPDFSSLGLAPRILPAMLPQTPKEAKVGSLGDAARGAELRLRARDLLNLPGLAGIRAVWCCATDWNARLQPPGRALDLDAGGFDDRQLDRYRVALAELPPRVLTRKAREATGRGKGHTAPERQENFLADSIVRPVVAENLALGRPWYAGFVRLLTGLDAGGNPLRDRLAFERKGLHAMTTSPTFWDHEGEAAVVRAVHEALRNRYGRIADENKGNPAARTKRFAGEYDRWRLAFAGAKTAARFRNALCDLFSRAGGNAVLRGAWAQVLPFLDERRWQLGRDLALLALASYAGRGEAERPGPADAAADPDGPTPEENRP
jgi:CRISPR-associated protein Cas8a1/Csx13